MCRRRLVWVSLLAMLAVAETASAVPITLSLSDFVFFSGGGATANSQTNYETSIGGHTTINGNIGSNQDLFMQGNPEIGYPAQLNGSAYVGGYLSMGQALTVGGPTALRELVVNGTNIGAPAGAAEAAFSGTLYGNMFVAGQATNLTIDLATAASVVGNVAYTGTAVVNTACPRCDAAHVSGTVTSPSTKTFTPIIMPAATNYTAGGANQSCTNIGGCTSLTLAPNTTYGTLQTDQGKTVFLSSGNYYFDELKIGGSNLFKIDLTSGLPIKVYVVGPATFDQSETLMVKGAGMSDYVSINDPAAKALGLAGLIYWETHNRWVMGGGSDSAHQIWGGTVYASLLEDGMPSGMVGEVDLGQYVIWSGAIYAFDSIRVDDHGLYDYVPLTTTAVPEPASLLLLGSGLVVGAVRRRNARA